MRKIACWSALTIVLLGSGVTPAAAGLDNDISLALANLQSNDPQVQARAHARLVCLDRAAVPELIRLLGDESCPVRPELARILGEIGAGEAIDPLIRALQTHASLKDGELYQAALEGLSLFKDQKVIETLIKELGREETKVSKNERVSNALAKIGPPAVPALLAALRNESEIRRSWVIKTLGNMRPIEALQPLIAIVKSSPNGISRIPIDAAVALGNLGEEGKEALRCLARDESPRVRGIAIKGLVDNWDVEFDICRAFFDDYWSVCMATCDAILFSLTPDEHQHCSLFQSYIYQANRLVVRSTVPIVPTQSVGEVETAEPIRIMVAVVAKGTVDHAWLMKDDATAAAQTALAAVKHFRFEPLEIDGQAIPVRTVMTFTRSHGASGETLEVGFDNLGKNEINSITYCYSPIRVKPIRLSFPETPQDMQKKEMQGTVIMEAETDIYGRIKSCIILTGAQPNLDRLAKAAILKWVYEPYILNGMPKPHFIQGHFHFLPNGIVVVKEQVIR